MNPDLPFSVSLAGLLHQCASQLKPNIYSRAVSYTLNRLVKVKKFPCKRRVEHTTLTMHYATNLKALVLS